MTLKIGSDLTVTPTGRNAGKSRDLWHLQARIPLKTAQLYSRALAEIQKDRDATSVPTATVIETLLKDFLRSRGSLAS